MISRNSPCHCGSGKKYKKCCLIKDEDRSRLEQNPELLYEEDESIEDVESEYIFSEEEPEEEINKFITPKVEHLRKPKLVLPKTTIEEEKIINDWLDKYIKIKDPDELLVHLNNFLKHQKKLVPHLGLEGEVLFELQALLLRHGRGKEYIEVLLDIRKEFPEVYLQSYSYYDRDLIVYYICEGELDKASEFMGNFINYPDDNPDVLFDLINFLCVTNQQILLANLLGKTYLQVLYSENIIGGEAVIEPFLWASYYIPKLENIFDEKSALELSNVFKTLKIDMKDEFYEPKFLLERVNQITRKIEEPLDKIYKLEKNVTEFYYQISINFIGWLHDNKNIPWLTAYYYHTLVFKYYSTSVPINKRPKIPFLFIKGHFESDLVKMSKNFIFVNAVSTLSSFRAFYWFSEYLSEHHGITEKEAEELQGWCKEFNLHIIPKFLQEQYEAKYFTSDILSKNN